MRRALGKGLAQLLHASEPAPTTRKAARGTKPPRKPVASTDPQMVDLQIGSIRPNARQPRRRFDPDGLEDLARSIREVGVLQPVLVRDLGDGKFELVAGERRLRAAQRAELRSIPAIVRPADGQTSLELALVENLQREDIGPMECAHAYRQLAQEFGLTQEQIAARVGKSRVAVANALRLFKLSDKAIAALEAGEITEGHARALLMAGSQADADKLLDLVVDRGLSVRQTEDLARRLDAVGLPGPPKPKAPPEDPNWTALADGLSVRFGAPVRLNRGKKGGQLVVDFFSDDDLQRILDLLGFRL